MSNFHGLHFDVRFLDFNDLLFQGTQDTIKK